MMESLVGQMLNRYQILSLLGEGGMGAVYKARDTTLERDVAIKVMYTHFAHLADFQERFLQEARAAARLDHPNIVQVHDFGQQRDMLYIVMKYIPGDDLEMMLEKMRSQKQWILLPEAIQVVRQVSLALDYAHRQGILHRDIKPGNIMIETSESEDLPYRPVLTDLGLAKLAKGGVMTQAGVTMGTPAYMSPEQSLGKPSDARSDVYSLGVLLFELCTAQLPFPAQNAVDAIKYHAQTPPPMPRSIRPDLPQELENITLKAMAKEPEKRYQSAGVLAETLNEVTPSATLVVSAPSALGSAISLVTQYQQSLVEERAKSILDEFAALPTSAQDKTKPADQDRIQILANDRTSHTVLVLRTGMFIGRDPTCEIRIEDRKASRQHARLEFDGTYYRIIDLNSTNGTYLGNERMSSGGSQIWTPDKVLRIGDTWLRMLPAGVPAGVFIPGNPPMTAVPETVHMEEPAQVSPIQHTVYAQPAQVERRSPPPPSSQQSGGKTGFPIWVLPVGVVLCLAMAAVMFLLFNTLIGAPNRSTQTAEAGRAALALYVNETKTAIAATLEALKNANLITQQAATATSDLYAVDPSPLATSTSTPDLLSTQNASAAQTASAAKTSAAWQATLNGAAASTAQALQLTSAVATANLASTLTAQARGSVAYIFSSDTTTADDFRTLLENNGYQVDLIPQDSIPATSFGAYKAILVGHETGNPADWGDSAGVWANNLAMTGKPLLGLGVGGCALFGKLGLLVGHPNEMFITSRDIIALNPSYPVWNTPNPISIPSSQIIPLYTVDTNTVTIYFPTMLMGTEPIGRAVSWPDHYPIILQNDQFLLWGFDPGPAQMTSKGQKVFINILDNLIP
jgi:serine/threonine protein kinase